MFEAQIKVTLKKTVADPQGQTIKHALESFGFSGIERLRMGKFITVTIKAKDQAEAKAQAEKMCQKLLANPIIEDYSIEVKPL
ncbi:MAG: phosphoribosylformylglycinamidine synthase subunit PurS [Candidatus Margulisiibacteriota bacterium]